MFMGEYQHTIDPKGRVSVPAKFREALGENFVVTKGLDKCLFAYPKAEWKGLEQSLRQLSFTKSDSRAFARLLFSGAAEVEIDKQGRILLPGSLREHGELTKEVMIIGVGARVEIWSKDAWLNYNETTSAQYEEIAEKLADFGIGL